MENQPGRSALVLDLVLIKVVKIKEFRKQGKASAGAHRPLEAQEFTNIITHFKDAKTVPAATSWFLDVPSNSTWLAGWLEEGKLETQSSVSCLYPDSMSAVLVQECQG